MTVELNGVPVEVWYPAAVGSTEGLERETYDMRSWLPEEDAVLIPDADSPLHETDAYRDVEALDDRFPLVLFSHGLGGYRLQTSFLMTHLASWGMIVAAPEHPERGLAQILAGNMLGDDAPQTLLDTVELMRGFDADDGHALAGRIDADRLVVSGHSQGGSAVTILAGDTTAGVDGWIGLATAIAPNEGTSAGMMIGGTLDGFATPTTMQTQWDAIGDGAAQRLIGIKDAGHMAFTDLCVIGADQGGILEIARDHGIEIDDLVIQLASDGCQDEAMDPESAWPIINHYVTAHVFDAVGGAPPDLQSGLDDSSRDCFDGAVSTLQEK
jgi:pimeloyl-ACP methyl ester carboxylesterase